MEMKIIRGGMLTTVQDLGRAGVRGAGVPRGGAMDAFALRLANLLVGNVESAAALEMTLVGAEVEFLGDALVAVTGADMGGMEPWQPHVVAAGTRLKFGAAKSGCRSYLAVAGGVDVAPVLGGRGTYLRAGLGGFEGRALRDGDRLRLGLAQAGRAGDHWRIDRRLLPAYSAAPTVRVLRGAQADEFAGQWWQQEFTVSVQSDRMGIRLEGDRLARSDGSELISRAVLPGTIQVPADGQPIALMADAQTLGGYPQLAQVITVDLPLLAQVRPGDKVRFVETTLSEAHRLWLAREHALSLLHEGLGQKLG